jgi:aryl-alcohol dehydrogenase-like predicted oxidoreductase
MAMDKTSAHGSMDRREFIKISAAAIGAPVLLAAANSETKEPAKADQSAHRNERPSMTYRKLGRTHIMSSRLVFGCGAALAGGKAVRVLDRAFEAGINHYDVGSNVVYKGSERSLAPFLKAHRDEIWVISKTPVHLKIQPGESVTVEQAKEAADGWTKQLDGSLVELDTNHIAAYYLMGVGNPVVIRCEELYKAFQKAKVDGKVDYFGLSTHKNAQAVLEAAIETGWYDIAMIGVTPAGWYDWDKKDLAEGTPPLTDLQPLLAKARAAGIGLVGMKAARHLAPKLTALGRGDTTAFDKVYEEKFKASPLSAFQRTYAYVLEHGLDVVNADMQNLAHLEENVVAAATSPTHFS